MSPILQSNKKRPGAAPKNNAGPKAKSLKYKTTERRYIQRKNAKPAFKKKIQDLSESDFDSDEDFGLNGPEFGPLSDSETSEEIEPNDNKDVPMAPTIPMADVDDDSEEDEEMDESENEEDEGSEGESEGSDDESSSEEDVPEPEGSVEGDSSDDEKESKPKVPSKDPATEQRTVFVGNLPCTVGKMKVKKWFSKYGEVESVRLRCPPIANPDLPKKVATIQKDFHTERTNISAFVKFKSDASVAKALRANGTQWDDTHHIRVDRASGGKAHDDKKAVFIGNLPFDVEEDKIRNVFVDCGDISDVRIVRDRRTNVGKGFAYVNFAERHSVPLALTKNGQKIGNRFVRVEKSNYKGPSGSDNKASKTFLNKRKAYIDKKFNPKKPKTLDSSTDKPAGDEPTSFQGSQATKREKRLKRKKNQREKKNELKKNNLIQVLSSKSKKPSIEAGSSTQNPQKAGSESVQGSKATDREERKMRKMKQREKKKALKKNNLIQVLSSKSKKPNTEADSSTENPQKAGSESVQGSKATDREERKMRKMKQREKKKALKKPNVEAS